MKQISPVGFAVVLALAIGVLGGSAYAQINSVPPPLMGQRSYHLYSVSFIRTPDSIRFFLVCTNTTSAAIRVGVEGFFAIGGPAANDPSANSVSVAAGGTVTFGSNAVWLTPDSNPGLGGLLIGSARVLATKLTGIICTAFLADVMNDPPTSMVQLTIVKKTGAEGGLRDESAAGDGNGQEHAAMGTHPWHS